MRHAKIFGLVLMAAFALAAVASSSASAACGDAGTKPCFHGPYPNHFVATQLGTGLLETVGTGKTRTVECKGGSALGFIRSEKDVLISSGIIYTGCKSTTFGAECNSAGAANGEIKTLPVLGLLGYINKNAVPPEVGLLFEPDNGGTHFATFTCTAFQTLKVSGTVICHLSPVNNTPTEKFHLLCEQTKGVQNPLSFEGAGTTDTLMTKGEGLENFNEQSGVRALSDVLTLSLTLILA